MRPKKVQARSASECACCTDLALGAHSLALRAGIDCDLLNRPGFAASEQVGQLAFLLLGFRIGNLSVDHVVVGVSVDIAEHANRLGKLRVTHSRKQKRQLRRSGFFVMEKQIVLSNVAVELDDFGGESVKTDSFGAIRENQRLAMFQLDRAVGLGVLVLGVIPSPVIEHVAVLVDLNEGGAFVLGSSFELVTEPTLDVGEY